MAYEAPAVGTILPAQQNTTVANPGPVHNSKGLDEFTQADQQEKAYIKNQALVADWHNAQKDSPAYAEQLGAAPSWAVVVIEAEAGGVGFDHQRVGGPVSAIEQPTQHQS